MSAKTNDPRKPSHPAAMSIPPMPAISTAGSSTGLTANLLSGSNSHHGMTAPNLDVMAQAYARPPASSKNRRNSSSNRPGRLTALSAPAERIKRFAEPEKPITPEGKQCNLRMTLQMPGAEKPEKWKFNGRPGEEPDETMARMRTSPAYNAAEVVYAFNGTPNDTLRGMVNELDRQTKAVNGGDLSQMEAMLTAQAHTLDAIFTRLAKRAHKNIGEHFEAGETYMRLAFKAQSQCRATVESLGQLKNPSPVAFVKQANIAAGHQQINNGAGTSPNPTRAGNFEIPPSKLLEANHGEWLDTGTALASGGANQTLETLAKINRPEDGGRKGKGRKERR